MSDWHVGQMVVCTASDWCFVDNGAPATGPSRGDILTIAEIEILSHGWFWWRKTSVYLDFVERDDGPYNSMSFRPVRKTSLDVFNVVRNGLPQKVTA